MEFEASRCGSEGHTRGPCPHGSLSRPPSPGQAALPRLHQFVVVFTCQKPEHTVHRRGALRVGLDGKQKGMDTPPRPADAEGESRAPRPSEAAAVPWMEHAPRRRKACPGLCPGITGRSSRLRATLRKRRGSVRPRWAWAPGRSARAGSLSAVGFRVHSCRLSAGRVLVSH